MADQEAEAAAEAEEAVQQDDEEQDNEEPVGFVPVDGDVFAPVYLSEEDSISQILFWIGFTDRNKRRNIITDSFSAYNDIKMLNEKDITSMALDWAGRTNANGRIHFGLRRTKLLKALVNWVQDFYRISAVPTIANINKEEFISQLHRAIHRAEIRNTMKDASANDESSPGMLESERQWKQWEEKFVNHLRCQLGSNGIPLSYIIRENNEPNRNGDFPDFITQTIECAPLHGEYFKADRLTVFNLIVSFTTGQPSGDWIKNTLRYSNGRRSMKALRTHFAGEGNATRNLSTADRLKESLHYRSERSMTFENFLNQCQKMYTIYDKEGDPMSDEAKVRFLFKKIQHSSLRTSIEALKAQMTAGVNITYTMAANHLTTAVSELPEFIQKNNRNISGVGTSGSSSGGSADIYNSDGSIITGHIPTWRTLSQADRDIVKAERKRLGTKGKKSKSFNNNDSNRMKQLSDHNKKLKRQIKALQRKGMSSSGDGGTADDTIASDDDEADPGDQFGGKLSKKKQKKK